MALHRPAGQALDFGLGFQNAPRLFRLSVPANPESNPQETAAGIWDYSEDRLADLGALIVFRHWLRSLLQDQADAKAALQQRRPSAPPDVEPRYGRLFF